MSEPTRNTALDHGSRRWALAAAAACLLPLLLQLPGQLALVSAAHRAAPSTTVTNDPPMPAIATPSPTLIT